MKKLLLFVFISINLHINAQISYADLQDGTTGITNGYGAWGNNSVVQENTINVPNKGEITFYHPDIAQSQLPVIFFISGWGRQAYSYEKYFYFLASLGYSVVNIYNTNPGNINESYQNSLDMMIQAAETEYPGWIDTTKVGIMGHSYGGGSTIWLGKQVFENPRNWGANGRFIFMTAPWYSLLVTENDLLNYPSDVKLLIEINNDDLHEGSTNWNTSERAIRAVFELINIPNDEKDFVRIYSDPTTYQYDSDNDGNIETYHYDANHYISYTGNYNSYAHYQPYDALDVYAINRLSHALIDYVFEGNLQGKTVALGNGNAQQVDMGFLTNLAETDTPVITRPENQFQYKCNEHWNDFQTNQNTWFLQNACSDTDGDGIIDVVEQLSINTNQQNEISIYPNPASDYIYFNAGNKTLNNITISIFDMSGKKLIDKRIISNNRFDISSLTQGCYLIKIENNGKSYFKKITIK